MKTLNFNSLLRYGFLAAIVVMTSPSIAWDNNYYRNYGRYGHSRSHIHSNYSPIYPGRYRFRSSSNYYSRSDYSTQYEYHSYSIHHYGSNGYYQSYYYPLSFQFPVPSAIKVYVDNGAGPREIYQRDGFKNLAWQALKQGELDTALNYFAIEADSQPNSGVPLSGYALTTASLGNLEFAIKIMRKAFRTNPEAFKINPNSLRLLQLDNKSLSLINNLIERYSSKSSADVDRAFMLSVLYYLKHDYEAAKKSLIFAQESENPRLSTMNLQRLINQQLQSPNSNVATLTTELHQ